MLQVFAKLRDLAVKQGFKQQEDAAKFKLTYKIGDVAMCRGAFARLRLMGQAPRLRNLQQNVMQGKHVPDIDTRYLKKKKDTKPTAKTGEIISYLESLYHSVAESLPENDNTREDFDESDQEDVNQSNGVIGMADPKAAPECFAEDKVRFLPPGSIFQQWKQYLALGNVRCSFSTFVDVWRKNFPHMRFRGSQQHAVCSVCTKHKLLIRCLGNNIRAQNKQRLLYERHLSAQYADRQCYWRIRGQSRAGPDTGTLSIIIDSIDQQKCAWPRSRHFKSKQFDGFQRPRLHVTACVAHGHAALLFLGHSDVSQCGSTTVEQLSHMLTVLRDKGVPLHTMNLHVQMDNAASTNKNSTVFQYMAGLVQVGTVQSATASFLRVGHTHEETWTG